MFCLVWFVVIVIVLSELCVLFAMFGFDGDCFGWVSLLFYCCSF